MYVFVNNKIYFTVTSVIGMMCSVADLRCGRGEANGPISPPPPH